MKCINFGMNIAINLVYKLTLKIENHEKTIDLFNFARIYLIYQ